MAAGGSLSMSRKSVLSSTDFVITADESKSMRGLPRRLAQFGSVEPLKGHPGLLILSADPKAAAPKELLERVRASLGRGFQVEPVMMDERGNRVVPTGKVTVRFKTLPSADELRKFAGPLGLTVDARNAYVPSQVSFRIADRSEDGVADVIERIEKNAESVQQVWPETLGSYRRG
jgi:hypothetical protein